MAEAVAETVKEATVAVQVAAKPNVFVTIVALAAMAAVGALVWRDEVRADAQIAAYGAQTDVLRKIDQHLTDVDGDLKAAGIPIGKTRAARLAVQAAARSDTE